MNPVLLLVTKSAVCCYAQPPLKCESVEPRSPFLTCTHLLTFDSLRIVVWSISIFGIVGNVLALIKGFTQRKQQRNKVQYLLITNLSISDLMMCIYLIILVSADMNYADFFPTNSKVWRSSTLCRFAGALSVLSSEASAFLIMLISIDRFLRVKYRYPFGTRRLTMPLARFLLAILWLVALGFGTATYVLSGMDTKIYSISEVCIGLPISKSLIYNASTSTIQTDHHGDHPISVKILTQISNQVSM